MRKEATRQKIIKAAGECLQRIGNGNVSLDDISTRAGVHRQTIYRNFKNREQLLNAVMIDRLQRFTEHIEQVIAVPCPMDEAIINATIESLDLTRRDPVLMSVLHQSHEGGEFYEQMIARKSDTVDRFNALYRPLFARGKHSGELSPRLTFSQFSKWLRGAQYVLLKRDDLKRAEQVELMRLFIDPGFARKSR